MVLQWVRQYLGLSTIIFWNTIHHTNHLSGSSFLYPYSIFFFPSWLWSTAVYACVSSLLTIVPIFNKWKNKIRSWTHPPKRETGSERIYWQEEGIVTPFLFFWFLLEMSPLPFKHTHIEPHKPLYPLPWSPHNSQTGSDYSRFLCDITKCSTLPCPQSSGARVNQETLTLRSPFGP